MLVNNDKIDIELLVALALEITDRYKLILDTVPKSQEKLLRQLAASSIHFTQFVRDVYNSLEKKHTSFSESEMKFFEECGCDFKDKL